MAEWPTCFGCLPATCPKFAVGNPDNVGITGKSSRSLSQDASDYTGLSIALDVGSTWTGKAGQLFQFVFLDIRSAFAGPAVTFSCVPDPPLLRS